MGWQFKGNGGRHGSISYEQRIFGSRGKSISYVTGGEPGLSPPFKCAMNETDPDAKHAKALTQPVRRLHLPPPEAAWRGLSGGLRHLEVNFRAKQRQWLAHGQCNRPAQCMAESGRGKERQREFRLKFGRVGESVSDRRALSDRVFHQATSASDVFARRPICLN